MHELKPHHTETLTLAHASKRDGGAGDGDVEGDGRQTEAACPRDRNTHPETRKPLLFARVEREEEGELWGWPAVLVYHRTKQTSVAMATVRASRTGQQLGRPEPYLLLRP